MTGTENRKGTGWLIAYLGIMAMMIVSPTFFVSDIATTVNEFTAPKLKELGIFYLLLVVLALDVVNYYNANARIPDTKTVIMNFALSWFVSTIALIIVFTMIAVPNWYFALTEITLGKGSFVQWSVIAFNEGLLLILIAAVFKYGIYPGLKDSYASGNILGIQYNIPGWKRFSNGFPAAGFMAVLHYTAYRGSISTMLVAFAMFALFWWLRESLGFGWAEGLHFGWNFALAFVFGGI